MNFEWDELDLTAGGVRDAHGTITCNDIPAGEPGCALRLKEEASPFMQCLWNRALADVMSNHVTVDGKSYLGAGAKFGVKVFTRDIAYSGVLGVNRTHPELMRTSLRFTRDLRLHLGLKVPSEYNASAKGIPCEVLAINDETFMNTYRTNSFLRRTDDVIWLWAYHDLIGTEAKNEELRWLLDTGERCFSELYDPFFDVTDGLYFGQASFVDIHVPSKGIKNSGYPHEWDFADCLRLKTTCTNALYQRGLQVMADVATRLHESSAVAWVERAAEHREAMRRQLMDSEGRFHFYKLPDGSKEPRRSALASALVILCGVVNEDEAAAVLSGYPHTCFGIPLLDPPRKGSEFCYYHNRAAWPFVDALFCWAEQMATGKDTTPYAAALAARTCRPDGTFHEVVRLPDGDVRCSASQLWSAAGFINTCFRANLVEEGREGSTL